MYAETTLSQRDDPRRHRSAPVRSPDAKGDLQCLFKAYDAACLDFDADAVAAFYDLPCLISTPEGNAGLTARGEVRAFIARRFSIYRQQGLVSASMVALNIEALAAEFAQAKVTWSLSNTRGAEVINVTSAYTLRHAAGGWRIAHAAALDEAEKFAQQRPRAPLLNLPQRI